MVDPDSITKLLADQTELALILVELDRVIVSASLIVKVRPLFPEVGFHDVIVTPEKTMSPPAEIVKEDMLSKVIVFEVKVRSLVVVMLAEVVDGSSVRLAPLANITSRKEWLAPSTSPIPDVT